MTSLWEYRAGIGLSDRDLVGYDVEATDGSMGRSTRPAMWLARPTWLLTLVSGLLERSASYPARRRRAD